MTAHEGTFVLFPEILDESRFEGKKQMFSEGVVIKCFVI